jgi:autotransporter passenger strand-loop-strand repeat protein
VTQHASGFDVLYRLCRASGGSTTYIASAMRQAVIASGGAAVNSGGFAVSNAQIAELTDLVHEVWHSSGGSRALFKDRLKRKLGLVDGGKKFLAALSLACVLQTTFAPLAAWAEVPAVITVPEGGISRVDDKKLGTADTNDAVQMDVSSGGSAYYTSISTDGIQNIFSGGSASATSIYTGGIQNIFSGGSASATSIYTGGTQNIFSGGSARYTYISTGGTQNIFSGGSAWYTYISTGGTQNISSGGYAYLT